MTYLSQLASPQTILSDRPPFCNEDEEDNDDIAAIAAREGQDEVTRARSDALGFRNIRIVHEPYQRNTVLTAAPTSFMFACNVLLGR